MVLIANLGPKSGFNIVLSKDQLVNAKDIYTKLLDTFSGQAIGNRQAYVSAGMAQNPNAGKAWPKKAVTRIALHMYYADEFVHKFVNKTHPHLKLEYEVKKADGTVAKTMITADLALN